MKDIFNVHSLSLKVKCLSDFFAGSVFFFIWLFYLACRSTLVFFLFFGEHLSEVLADIIFITAKLEFAT